MHFLDFKNIQRTTLESKKKIIAVTRLQKPSIVLASFFNKVNYFYHYRLNFSGCKQFVSHTSLTCVKGLRCIIRLRVITIERGTTRSYRWFLNAKWNNWYRKKIWVPTVDSLDGTNGRFEDSSLYGKLYYSRSLNIL